LFPMISQNGNNLKSARVIGPQRRASLPSTHSTRRKRRASHFSKAAWLSVVCACGRSPKAALANAEEPRFFFPVCPGSLGAAIGGGGEEKKSGGGRWGKRIDHLAAGQFCIIPPPGRPSRGVQRLRSTMTIETRQDAPGPGFSRQVLVGAAEQPKTSLAVVFVALSGTIFMVDD